MKISLSKLIEQTLIKSLLLIGMVGSYVCEFLF